MVQQIPLPASAVIGQEAPAHVIEIARDLAYLRASIVNVVFLGGQEGWVLIDAGMPWSRRAILAAAQARFGEGVPPRAIILTHGHFDHVGALKALAEHWDVPVFAHPDEHPFLDGRRSYPGPRPRLGDGLMSALSPLYPRGPIDLGARLKALPDGGGVPFAPDWRWLHTPGHAPGHVSFWHEAKRRLVAGDAFVATAQESAFAVARQAAELHGPPRYFTPDWLVAERSVGQLAALEPALAITGHGRAVGGPVFTAALSRLAREFRTIAAPAGAAHTNRLP